MFEYQKKESSGSKTKAPDANPAAKSNKSSLKGMDYASGAAKLTPKSGGPAVASSKASPKKKSSKASGGKHAEVSLADMFKAKGYTYGDAMALGRHWHVSVSYAKAKAAAHIQNTGSRDLIDLSIAKSMSERSNEAKVAYSKSRFTPDDAKLLAKFWGTTMFQSKVYIGELIIDGTAAAVDAKLKLANPKWRGYKSAPQKKHSR